MVSEIFITSCDRVSGFGRSSFSGYLVGLGVGSFFFYSISLGFFLIIMSFKEFLSDNKFVFYLVYFFYVISFVFKFYF